jgi:hypothetical protein
MNQISLIRALLFAWLVAWLVTVSGAIAARTAPAPDILVSVRDGAVIAPDSIRPGWTRVRVEEDGGGHILVIFRLPETATDADMKAFLAALDTGRATPKPAIAMGGPEVGDTGEVVVQLPPGRYVLACVRQGAGNRRHASLGEAKLLIVSKRLAASPNPPPRATQQIRTVDFAYVGADRWTAGPQMLRVENAGRQDHQLRLIRLRPGSTLQDWVKASNPGRHGVAVAGVARLSPGSVAFLPVDVERGTYVLTCLVSDTASGRPHMALGMFREIHVE